MGNHDAGRAMALAARVVINRRRPEDTALGLLDEICELFRGCDAEFDDELLAHDASPLAQLATEAFAPGVSFEDDEDGGRFYELVHQRFSERYDLR